MKKFISLAVLIICTGLMSVSADDLIKGQSPDKFPPSEKCSACHNVGQTFTEIMQSAHKKLKCSDCHLPGVVQKKKYESRDCSFSRLGYHKEKGEWIEAGGNGVCLRCHSEKGIKDTEDKCWLCHMADNGTDEIVIVKDKKLPPADDNIREIKKVPHKSHIFKVHSKNK